MHKFLKFISQFLLCREIPGTTGAPYLERYSLIRTKYFSLYLHHFLDSDPDRGLHDHPFKWHWSFILAGYYYEILENGKQRFRGTFSVGKFDGYHKHRVFLIKDTQCAIPSTPCWTLFAHGPRVKGWGFFDTENNYRPIATDARSDKSDKGWETARRKIFDLMIW